MDDYSFLQGGLSGACRPKTNIEGSECLPEAYINCTDEVTVPVFRGLCHIWPLTVTDGASLKSGTIEVLLVHRYRLAVFRRCRRRHIDSLFLHQAAGRSLPPAKGQTRPWARKSQPSSGCEKYSVNRSSRAQAKENFCSNECLIGANYPHDSPARRLASGPRLSRGGMIAGEAKKSS